MCYKSGGCGVYENRSCSECPASKPEYAKRGGRATAGIYDDAMAIELTREQIKKIIKEKYFTTKPKGENKTMGRLRIRLDTQRDAARLAQIAGGLDGQIVITDGNGLRVSAKSVMGMLYAMEFEELWLESENDIYMKVQDFVVVED